MGDPEEPPTEKGLTPSEIIDKFPALIAIFNAVVEGVKEAQVDGKVSAEELGTIVGGVMRPLGRLVDEVIQDIND